MNTNYSEAEIQALITLLELAEPIETPNNNFYPFFPQSMAAAQTYFRRFALDLAPAFEMLAAKGLVGNLTGSWLLTPTGRDLAREIRRLRPPIYYWYKDFYQAIAHSPAFAEYSWRVFGLDLGQHGFSDMTQLHLLLEVLALDPPARVLDIGCGSGQITEYLSDFTGAAITGLDYIPEAIAQAQQRTVSKQNRLTFQVGHLDTLEFPPESFEAIISIDSIFFGQDLAVTLNKLRNMLKPGGQMAIFCGDDLAPILAELQFSYTVYDLSRENYEHLQLKHRVVCELQAAFIAEGNGFISDNLLTESIASADPYPPEANPALRYLYHLKKTD